MIKKKEEPLFVYVDEYYEDVFKHYWHIVFTNDINREVAAVLKDKGATEKEIKRWSNSGKNVCAQVCNIELKNGKNWDVALFNINKYTNNTGVHEAFHIVKEILYTRGLRIDKTASSEEPWAYLLGHVFDSINTAYKVSLIRYKEFKKDIKAKPKDEK